MYPHPHLQLPYCNASNTVAIGFWALTGLFAPRCTFILFRPGCPCVMCIIRKSCANCCLRRLLFLHSYIFSLFSFSDLVAWWVCVCVFFFSLGTCRFFSNFYSSFFIDIFSLCCCCCFSTFNSFILFYSRTKWKLWKLFGIFTFCLCVCMWACSIPS